MNHAFVSYSETTRAVQRTRELDRVLTLPRRVWSDENAAELAREMTARLRTLAGTMALRAIQAIALYEILVHGGLLLSARVGAGKTIVSLLAFRVLQARRGLLLLPSRLVSKTRREFMLLRQHWDVPGALFPRIESYELLGRVSAGEKRDASGNVIAPSLLDAYQPDVIVADECQRLKNTKAAVTKRVKRYVEDRGPRFVGMSGTVTARSLRDYAHLLAWALGAANAPLPMSWSELEEWAEAIDVKTLRADGSERERSVGTGALVALCNAEESAIHASDPVEACRRAYSRRLTETPGVVATSDRFLGASLSIAALEPAMGPNTDAAFKHLRDAWALPDDHPLADATEVWRHARELALGFFYRWDPPPPREWLERRRVWCAISRQILRDNRRNLDSELQVTNAVDAGLYPDPVEVAAPRRVEPGAPLESMTYVPLEALDAWRAVRDSFRPRTVPVWLDDGAIFAAAEWAKMPGIVWTEHRAFAERLAQYTGLPYYGEQGLNAQGQPIESADPKRACIASIKSNSEGRNLQHLWSRNLITSAPKLGLVWEQLLGRTHRDGQTADEVTADIVVTCREHAGAWAQAMADARYIEASIRQEQKILYADVDMPAEHWR